MERPPGVQAVHECQTCQVHCSFYQVLFLFLTFLFSRFGIKVWALADSISSYVWNFSVYTGRNAAENVVDANQGVAAGVIMKLTEPLWGKGYHVY